MLESPKTGIVAKDKNSIFTVLLPQAPENVQFFMRKKRQVVEVA